MDFTKLVEAIKLCSQRSIKSTARLYSIPRTTLGRYVKNVENEFGDIETVHDSRLIDFVRGCNQRVPTNQVMFFYLFKMGK